VAPRAAALVVIEANGRRGREAGNDGFRIGRGRAVCREGEVGEASGEVSGEASGDETRGRLVLIASDMIVDPVE
jgi:hypothetical protein